MQAANSKEDLGAFKKTVLQSDLVDKADTIRELQNGVLYTSWAAILQLQ